jgi:hypothetical protein
MREFARRLLAYLLARRKEPTSVVSYILAIGTVTGRQLNPEMVAAEVAIAAGLISLILYLWPELDDRG